MRELALLEEIATGALRARFIRSNPAKPELGFPPGTLSQMIEYYRDDVRVLIVHRYLLPDGRIGASGLPDPKLVRDGNVVLMFKPPHLEM